MKQKHDLGNFLVATGMFSGRQHARLCLNELSRTVTRTKLSLCGTPSEKGCGEAEEIKKKKQHPTPQRFLDRFPCYRWNESQWLYHLLQPFFPTCQELMTGHLLSMQINALRNVTLLTGGTPSTIH